MLKIDCMLCGEELNEPGALFISPPLREDVYDKDHLCESCYLIVYHSILNLKKELKEPPQPKKTRYIPFVSKREK